MSSSEGQAVRKRLAAVGTSAFLAAGPGVLAGVIPWRQTGWTCGDPCPALPAAILGQALLLGRPILVLYGAGAAVAVVTFVRRYEEPTLLQTFGAEYQDYRRNVPGMVAPASTVAWRERRTRQVRPFNPFGDTLLDRLVADGSTTRHAAHGIGRLSPSDVVTVGPAGLATIARASVSAAI